MYKFVRKFEVGNASCEPYSNGNKKAFEIKVITSFKFIFYAW